MAVLNFNAATVAPDTGTGDPVPAGWYNVVMDESEMKPTKDGTGAFLACRFNILDGQYANRKLFTRLNIRNNNPTAQEIAYKQLSAICHAVGQIQCSDSSELHAKPLKIKVKLRPASGDYEASNDISGYKNINDNTVGMTAPSGTITNGQFQHAPQQMPAQQPWQPAPQQQPAQQFQQAGQFVQPGQGVPQQQPQAQYQQAAQQPMQQPAQAPQQQVQYQQAPQQQSPQQQPQQAPAGAPQQPWENAAQQPWSQPQPQQAPVQQPMQQAPQQQMQPAQQNPVVQQYAGATPPWQQ